MTQGHDEAAAWLTVPLALLLAWLQYVILSPALLHALGWITAEPMLRFVQGFLASSPGMPRALGE